MPVGMTATNQVADWNGAATMQKALSPLLFSTDEQEEEDKTFYTAQDTSQQKC